MTISALSSVKSGTSSNRQDVIYEIMSTHSQVIRQGTEVIFMWVPAHIGITGNEKLDRLELCRIKLTKSGNNIGISRQKEGIYIQFRIR